MNQKRFVQRAKHGFWVVLFFAYAAVAASVVIDTLKPAYRNLSHVAVASVHAPREVRLLAASQAAAIYRASSGTPFSALPPGSRFKIVWPDGSAETIIVVDPKSADGAALSQGSQQDELER